MNAIAYQRPAEFTPQHEGELYWFFAMYRCAVPGTKSVFGAMLRRDSEKKRRTTERPSPEAQWTQLVKCGRQMDTYVSNPMEDEMIAYLDDQRRASRVRAALARLTPVACAVLEARYGFDPVDPRLRMRFREYAPIVALTDCILAENRHRTEAGEREPMDTTIGRLFDTAVSKKGGRTGREAAQRTLALARRQAMTMLVSASADYAAARFVRGAR
jgi:hypothetical protein